MGVDLNYPILGHSIYSDEKTDVNFMMFNDTFALRKKDEIAIIIPNKEAQTFIYKDFKLIEKEHNKTLENSALALVTILNDMYEKKLFQ